jgi:uncharacterized membrane protein required for colicin V production
MRWIDFIIRLNWIDILVIILIIRITYIAIQRGVFVEIFKDLGVIVSVFICLHYYTRLGDFLENLTQIRPSVIEFWDFCSFFFLWIVVTGFFVFLRWLFFSSIKIETLSFINRVFSFLLGFLRAVLVSSLFMFVFSIPAVNYFKKSVEQAYLGRRIFFVSPSLYKGLHNNLVSKFFPQEKINPAVKELEEELK